MYTGVVAVFAGIVAGVLANLAPQPADVVGAVAVGMAAALAVAVVSLRNRLRRIEEMIRRHYPDA